MQTRGPSGKGLLGNSGIGNKGLMVRETAKNLVSGRASSKLSSYENHRYMMDWWLSDWGDPALDAGHFVHRKLAGQQILGMNTDGNYPRTSNFMEHGTLAGRIRQDDYRPYLLALYGNLCYAMDSGNRYAPEDALLPGNYPREGSPYAWSAVMGALAERS